MQCPQCGYVFAAFEHICPRCAQAARTTHVAAGAGNAYKVCPVCGQPAVLEAVSCGRCGHGYRTRFGAGSPVAQWAAPRRGLGRTGWVVAGLLLFLVTGGVFVGLKAGSRRAAADKLLLQPSRRGGWQDPTQGAGVNDADIQSRLASAGATAGDLEVTLAWNTLTDLDLSVLTPDGELIDGHHARSTRGGRLDIDANPTLMETEALMRARAGQRISPSEVAPIPEEMIDADNRPGLPLGIPGFGFGRGDGTLPSYEAGRPRTKFTRSPVEHIFFPHARRGVYVVYVSCCSWREPDRRPLPCTAQVRYRGAVANRISGTMGPQCEMFDLAPPVEVCRFTVP